MRKSTIDSILKLPQSTDTWYLGSRQLRIWITPEDRDPYQPTLLVMFNLDQDLIINFEIVGQSPTKSEFEKFIVASMRKKQEEFEIHPKRPTCIHFENNKTMKEMRPALNAVEVQVKYRPHTELLTDLIKRLEQHMREDRPEIPGLLSHPGINPKMIGSLFDAAADFYRAAPWVSLRNDDVLAIRISPQTETWYVTVLGHGGVEYGLALYKTWDDVKRTYLPKDHPDEWVPPTGAHSFLFNPPTFISFDDLEAIQKYGWQLVDFQTIPAPMIFFPPDEVERPERDEILWYEAVMRAIPVFEEEYLKTDKHGDRLPCEAQIPVQIYSGATIVEIKIPAGELPKTGTWGPGFDEFEEVGEVKPEFDRRTMEKDLAQMTSLMGEEQVSDPQLNEAQELIYQAWEDDNPARRIILAHRALKISPNCADAYVLLAEEEADSPERALQLYQSGVQAGERALGEDYFQQNSGHFWGLLETRPYMRALEGVARCQWILGKKDESILNYQKLLDLNPGDNQGIRYILTDLYLGYKDYKALDKLIREYENDWSAVWLYTRALLTFRKSGKSKEANQILNDAIGQNSFVPDYLTGKKRIPAKIPNTIGWGDESEAVSYACDHLNHWRETPGAVAWLKKRFHEERPMPGKPNKKEYPALRDWVERISEDHLAIAENLPLRKDAITLITYLRDHRVTGTNATGNLPLKAVREVASQFVHPPILETVIGEKTYHIRSEYDVWPLYFLHILVELAGLVEGGQSRRWRVTLKGESFLSDPAQVQVQELISTWWHQVNWLIAFEYEDIGEDLPRDFVWVTLRHLLDKSVNETIPFEAFADQLIEAGKLVWRGDSQDFARDNLHAAIQSIIIHPMADFGVLETEYEVSVKGNFKFKDLVAFRLTSFGKKLLETIK
jgi:tetratricopeptide (TPR) repeat protein